MIPIVEIKEAARIFGVPPSTIERDYAQNWLLAHLGALPMALKGGTGIRKVFIESYRFSDDLDFTLLEPCEKEILKEKIVDAVSRAREESGIRFEEDISIVETTTGFRATSLFRIIPMSASTPTRIIIDLTTVSNENVLLPVLKREIYHPYSDKLFARVPSYSLEEIMAEKIRSLFQRVRPRDIYDIWCLADHVNPDAVRNILYQKCECKKVTPDNSALTGKHNQFSAAWNASLRHQMKTIPDFEKAFGRALECVELYTHR
ncbi:MAG: nucleotidyl transferase AbiEii/AbiGii toxin family protein [Methanoculleus sp.]|jgi:predicted nucleotidyltransferase component of viral defense system|nr:CRISPR-associated protein Csx11 [Methanomicrobiales archaeon]